MQWGWQLQPLSMNKRITSNEWAPAPADHTAKSERLPSLVGGGNSSHGRFMQALPWTCYPSGLVILTFLFNYQLLLDRRGSSKHFARAAEQLVWRLFVSVLLPTRPLSNLLALCFYLGYLAMQLDPWDFKSHPSWKATIWSIFRWS